MFADDNPENIRWVFSQTGFGFPERWRPFLQRNYFERFWENVSWPEHQRKLRSN